MQTFCEIARKDFREAYHLFTEKDFLYDVQESRQKAESVVCRSVRTASNLSASGGISDQSEGKDPVSVSLKTTAAEFYNVEEDMQESFEIHRSGWGHLRLEIETKGEFLEPERHVITDEDFIGSSVQINYLVRADQLKRENHIGEIIVRSPYQELTYHVLASRGSAHSY